MKCFNGAPRKSRAKSPGSVSAKLGALSLGCTRFFLARSRQRPLHEGRDPGKVLACAHHGGRGTSMYLGATFRWGNDAVKKSP